MSRALTRQKLPAASRPGVSPPPAPDWPPRILRPLARHLHQICVTAVSDQIEDSGLTLIEFGVLLILGDSPGLDQNTVADWLAIDRTTISATVHALEKKKLIQREVHPEDRRARSLGLSKTGAALRERLRPKSLAAQQRVMSVLSTAERETFLSLLVRVVQANEDLAQPGSGRRKPTSASGKSLP